MEAHRPVCPRVSCADRRPSCRDGLRHRVVQARELGLYGGPCAQGEGRGPHRERLAQVRRCVRMDAGGLHSRANPARGPVCGDFLGTVWGIVLIFIDVVILAAAVRATIYQSFKAGYRVKTLWTMVSRDPWGLARIWLIEFVISVIEKVVAFLVLLPSLLGTIPISSASSSTSTAITTTSTTTA